MSVIYPTEIVNVLGSLLPVERTYGDGSFDCPHCGYPVLAPALDCSNPWCLAHPDYPVDAARVEHTRRVALADEAAARARNAAMATKRLMEEQAERARDFSLLMLECERTGACKVCAMEDRRVGRKIRMVKHRKACPRGNPEERDYMKLSKTKGLK